MENKRLTENIGDFAYTYNGTQKTNKEYDKWVFEVTCKLGKLEDLEEQLGCPLEVISAVLENGIYNEYYCYIPPYRIRKIDIFNKEIFYYDEETNGFTVKLYDYKKTWWLKSDKSE